MNVSFEHSQGRDLRQADIDWLTAQGVNGLALAKTYCGDFSFLLVDRVTFLDKQRFEFVRYLQGPFETASVFTMIIKNVEGESADILAWHPRTGQVATWLGAVAMLGEEQVHAPRLEHLTVHEGVLSWLKDARHGLVILDAARAARILDGAGPLVAPSVDFGKKLRKQLTIPAPEILVAQSQEIAA